MDKLCVRGGASLSGTVEIAGAKNAALPLMVASLLIEEPLVLENVPAVSDIETLKALLGGFGVEIQQADADGALSLNACALSSAHADYDLVRRMRASILVLGPLLAREGYAEVSLPGGCAIGSRPVNMHVEALEALGAEVAIDGGYVRARLPSSRSRLAGGQVVFASPSVGATENALLAASLAKGESKIINAACEPEVVDLANCLVKMGAEISGIGTSTLLIQGSECLQGTAHRVIPDRVEAGTYAVAAAITRGRVRLEKVCPDHLEVFLGMLERANVVVQVESQAPQMQGAETSDLQTKSEPQGTIVLDATGGALCAVDITTAPYPMFPTDLQAQFMALMTQAQGESHITESIFENRFMHVQELIRLGAKIEVRGATATVQGATSLQAAPVMATDLRASVSLVLAGLAAEGDTEIRRIYHLDRGYQNLEGKLRALGAEVWREPQD